MRIEVVVDSVAFLAEDQAVVRFTTQKVETRTGRKLPLGPWIATVGYAYGTPPLRTEDRRLNPWGLRITSYHVEPEAAVLVSVVSESALAVEGRP